MVFTTKIAPPCYHCGEMTVYFPVKDRIFFSKKNIFRGVGENSWKAMQYERMHINCCDNLFERYFTFILWKISTFSATSESDDPIPKKILKDISVDFLKGMSSNALKRRDIKSTSLWRLFYFCLFFWKYSQNPFKCHLSKKIEPENWAVAGSGSS